MNCCPNCFSDSFLDSRISVLSKKKGDCSFCKAKNVAIIQPELLLDYFDPLLDIYKEDTGGLPLNQLIQNDWAIFAVKSVSKQQKLLNIIMQDPDLSNKTFSK